MKKEKKNCVVIRHFDDDEMRKNRENRVEKMRNTTHRVHALYLHVRVQPEPDQQIIVILYSI